MACGVDHGTIIMSSMPDVFRFIPMHAKPPTFRSPADTGSVQGDWLQSCSHALTDPPDIESLAINRAPVIALRAPKAGATMY
jgi:hypothetical protein